MLDMKAINRATKPKMIGAFTNYESGARFHEAARRTDPVLLEEFDWLYERIRQALSKQLKEPVSMLPKHSTFAFRILDGNMPPICQLRSAVMTSARGWLRAPMF